MVTGTVTPTPPPPVEQANTGLEFITLYLQTNTLAFDCSF